MCNEYYLEKTKDSETIWYIDTCSIIKYRKLAKFVEKKSSFINEGVRITVIKPVYEELLKKMDSLDDVVAECASEGFKILKNNQDLFAIQGYNQETRCDEAFADPVLHKSISDELYKSNQVLITDDLNMAHDVNNLNNIRSFNSKRVYVCWINYDGELVRSRGASNDEIEAVTKTEEVVVKEVEKTIYIERPQSPIIKYGVPVVTGFGGIITGYYINQNKEQLLAALIRAGKRLRVII